MKLENVKQKIVIKENHRIDAGEIVQIHYNLEDESRIFCEVYEIINTKGEVVYRYKSNDKYSFIEK